MGSKSVFENLAEGEVNRQRSTFMVDMMATERQRQRQRDAMAPQQHAEATARKLDDGLFADDPEIQRLTQEHQTIAARVERLGRASRTELQAAIQRIEQEVSAVQDQVRGAAVDDVLAGDFDFPRGAALVLRAEQLRHQLEAARRALEIIVKPPHERTHFDAEAHRAKEALAVALLERKRAYVAAHPELLDGRVVVPQPVQSGGADVESVSDAELQDQGTEAPKLSLETAATDEARAETEAPSLGKGGGVEAEVSIHG
ncbi:hypothetical protein [Variovorax sp. YR216]|uniref:hypothetical protein n=1 Tax=Variovorax sp. YR216 TaxID=1882828 RepID=UPI00089BDA7F|nr:hypothetical protein [Variovorax sp. YR216]SEA76477.1 hypothetical protein SAMN05444680_103482 [Variovorax sp. YR216]